MFTAHPGWSRGRSRFAYDQEAHDGARVPTADRGDGVRASDQLRRRGQGGFKGG